MLDKPSAVGKMDAVEIPWSVMLWQKNDDKREDQFKQTGQACRVSDGSPDTKIPIT
jgi:hypothetical protein